MLSVCALRRLSTSYYNTPADATAYKAAHAPCGCAHAPPLPSSLCAAAVPHAVLHRILLHLVNSCCWAAAALRQDHSDRTPPFIRPIASCSLLTISHLTSRPCIQFKPPFCPSTQSCTAARDRPSPHSWPCYRPTGIGFNCNLFDCGCASTTVGHWYRCPLLRWRRGPASGTSAVHARATMISNSVHALCPAAVLPACTRVAAQCQVQLYSPGLHS